MLALIRFSPANLARPGVLQLPILVPLLIVGQLPCSPALAVIPTPIEPGTIHVRLETVAAGLDNVPNELFPADLAPFPDGTGRLAVGTFGGNVGVIDEGSGLLDQPFMTASQTGNVVIGPDGDHGLTSVTFHPDFANQSAAGYGKFYSITSEFADSGTADFGVGSHHQNVVREWNLSSGSNTIGSNEFVGSVADSRELLRFNQPGPFHNVSDLAFDDEAYLYIAVGDGGAGPTTAQDIHSALGSILKIDPLAPSTTDAARGAPGSNNRYRVPSDNPFVDTAGLDEVWAYGLRSPYRMNFDRATGDLWVGDVGAGMREEVNLVQSGDNLGWSTYEGTAGVTNPDAVAGFTFPILEYGRDEGVTVIGGFVYRGDAIAELEGKYVFAELGQGLPTARLLYSETDPEAPDYGTIYEFGFDPTGTLLPGDEPGSYEQLPDRIMSIGQDDQNELYLLAGQDPRSYTPSAPGGFVIRIEAADFILGDLNGDGLPFQFDDFRDVMVANLISTHPTLQPAETVLLGDFDADLDIDEDDFRFFKQQYQSLEGNLQLLIVPEPQSATLAAFLALLILIAGHARRGTSVRSGRLLQSIRHLV